VTSENNRTMHILAVELDRVAPSSYHSTLTSTCQNRGEKSRV